MKGCPYGSPRAQDAICNRSHCTHRASIQLLHGLRASEVETGRCAAFARGCPPQPVPSRLRSVYGLVSGRSRRTAFPRSRAQWPRGSARLTYRCGGSAGVGSCEKPYRTSRFTHRLFSADGLLDAAGSLTRITSRFKSDPPAPPSSSNRFQVDSVAALRHLSAARQVPSRD